MYHVTEYEAADDDGLNLTDVNSQNRQSFQDVELTQQEEMELDQLNEAGEDVLEAEEEAEEEGENEENEEGQKTPVDEDLQKWMDDM